MTGSLVILKNKEIVVFKDNKKSKIKWLDLERLASKVVDEDISIIYNETLDPNKNFILLSKFKKLSIDYEIVERQEIFLIGYIYNLWKRKTQEIIPVDSWANFLFLEFFEENLFLVSFSLENTRDNLNIKRKMNYSIKLSTVDRSSNYMYLEMREAIYRAIKKDLSKGLGINKIFLLGDFFIENDLVENFERDYGKSRIEKLVDNSDERTYDNFKIYRDVKKGIIKIPFKEKNLDYLEDDIFLSHYLDGTLYIREKIFKKGTIIPSSKIINIKPLNITEASFKYNFEFKDSNIFEKLDYPNIYRTNKLSLNMDLKKDKLDVLIKLDNQLIDYWEIVY